MAVAMFVHSPCDFSAVVLVLTAPLSRASQQLCDADCFAAACASLLSVFYGF